MDKIEKTILCLQGKEKIVTFYEEALKNSREINAFIYKHPIEEIISLTDCLLALKDSKDLRNKMELCKDILTRFSEDENYWMHGFGVQLERINLFTSTICKKIHEIQHPSIKSKSHKKQKRQDSAKNRSNNKNNGMRRH